MISKRACESKSRPFPWVCANCRTRTVVPTVMDHSAKIKHDGIIHDVQLHNVAIPRCQTCGEIYPATIDEQISTALRERLRFLTPAQIRKGIEHLGLKQQEFAERLGVAPETVSRWVNGVLIQSRAMDNFLRIYFALPEARAALRGPQQDPLLGISHEHQDCDGLGRLSASKRAT